MNKVERIWYWAHEEGKPTDSFYQDCPLGLHEEVSDETNR